MPLVPVMWTVWAAFVVFTAAVYIYRSSLTRDEEDQIFLDDSFEHEKNAQAMIVSKVAKVDPLAHVGVWLVVAMSVVVAIYYARDIMIQLHLIG
jgi:hypothetical protein